MSFFDLLFPNKRKQKEVDRFFLHALADASGEYKDVLTAAFEKIKKLLHTFPGDGQELMISYEEDAPRMDLPNDDCPFCSFKTNFGWVDFTALDGRIAFVHYENLPHKIDIKRCVIEEMLFFPELFNTPRKAMIEVQTKELPHDWENVTADLPPLQDFFFNAYLTAYRITLPETLQKLYRCCNGASSTSWRLYGLHEWSHFSWGKKNFWAVGEIEDNNSIIWILLDYNGKFYTCDDDCVLNDAPIKIPLPE